MTPKELGPSCSSVAGSPRYSTGMLYDMCTLLFIDLFCIFILFHFLLSIQVCCCLLQHNLLEPLKVCMRANSLSEVHATFVLFQTDIINVADSFFLILLSAATISIISVNSLYF